MTVQKLSQIATSPSNLAATDFLVGVTAGNVDYRFSPAQIGAASDITVNTTPIIGGTTGRLLYDNSGTVGETPVITFTIPGGGTGVLTFTGGDQFGDQIVLNQSQPRILFSDTETHGSNWQLGANVLGTNPIFELYDGTNNQVDWAVNLDGLGTQGLRSGAAIGWTSDANFANGALDTALWRDAAGIIAQRNGTNAQEFKVFNTWATGGTDFEAGIFDWTTTSNVLTIGTTAGGTGTRRGITFVSSGKISYTGDSIGGTNTGTGFALALGYNVTNNKQFWFGDPDYFGNVSATFIRVVTSNGLSLLDCVLGDNSASTNLTLGTSGHGIYIPKDMTVEGPIFLTSNFDTTISRGGAGIVAIGTGGAAGDVTGTLKATGLYTKETGAILHSAATITNGAGTGTGVTFTNAPGASAVTGNPTKWLPYDDNGTTRYIPSF